jgi:hypothetical protein
VRGKPSAEYREKYFGNIKISTQVLKSLWKSGVCGELTSRSSTELHALHNLSAIYFSSKWCEAKEMRIRRRTKELFLRNPEWRKENFADTEKIFLSFSSVCVFPHFDFAQYHFGGRWRWTLKVCLVSVMSYQRP